MFTRDGFQSLFYIMSFIKRSKFCEYEYLWTPDGWKPESKQLRESINKALKIFLEILYPSRQVQGQFWLSSLCVLLSECCMFVKMGTYSRVCVFVEDQGGFGVSIPGKTIFSFGYLNLHP